ncbi:MAG: VOC family protein [Candidatus Thorarchaeota archaeon]
MDNDANFLFKDLHICQLGYVYKDIEKQARIMEKFFGIPKFNILGPLIMEISLRGKQTKWTAKAGSSRLFDNVEVELIQPEGGESIHKEFLEQGREGLHHIRYDVEDLPAIIEKFEKEGITVLQFGKIVGLKYAYMDTESLLGIIVEFSAIKKGRRRR